MIGHTQVICQRCDLVHVAAHRVAPPKHARHLVRRRHLYRQLPVGVKTFALGQGIFWRQTDGRAVQSCLPPCAPSPPPPVSCLSTKQYVLV